MANGDALVPGYRGMRGQILLEVKKSQPITAKQLSGVFGVSANAVRRHLKELELGGLVRFGREQHRLGAPAFAYRLTDEGEALFPNGYRDALTGLLEQVAERDGRDAVVGLFEERYAKLTRKLQSELALAPRERRLEVVTRIMTEAGYMAEWSESAGVFSFAEHNCALRAVVRRFPEVCAAEEKFLKDVLGANVARRAHIASGCNACEYAISFGASDTPVVTLAPRKTAADREQL